MSDPRYSRQTRFSPIGEAGQQQIASSKVLLCGCGALGSLIAERLARAGVGNLRLVDRDWVELSNLQRQTLFTEQDASESQPKAVAGANALRKINSEITIESLVCDIDYTNIASLAEGCDLILDGTDNFETRFLINDYAVESKTPWVHGGCIGAGGQIMGIVPGQTACFRCLVPELPPRDASETCDSAGVLGSAIGIIASWQCAEALKILSGNAQQVHAGLVVIDSWHTDCRTVRMTRNSACPACGKHEFPFLRGEIRSSTTVLCGKNAVQIESPDANSESLDAIVRKVESLGKVTQNPYFVRLQLRDYQITIFRGGRTVVEGTTSPSEAKSLVAQTLGN